MRITINKMKKEYQRAIEKEEYESADEVGYSFWQVKKVRKAFEKYIGKDERNRINSNPYDTPCYKFMKPSEQGCVEGMFMDDVLTGRRTV